MAGKTPTYTARRGKTAPVTKAQQEKTEKKSALNKKTEKKTPAQSSLHQREEKRVNQTGAAQRRRSHKQNAAIMRDRRRVVISSGGFAVFLIAVLTAGFEAMGFLLLALRTPGMVDQQAFGMMAVSVTLGLFTTLVLPRVMKIDALTMGLTNFICGVSLVILYTVSPERGMRQTMFYALGLAVMLLMSRIVSRMRRAGALTIASIVLGIGALALPLLFGSWYNGAKNWVEVPFFGSFQPSEFVKLSLILSLAYYFSTHRTVLQMMPAIFFAAACLVMLRLQRDLGTALI